MSHCTVKLRVKQNIINDIKAVVAVAVGHKVYAFGGYYRNVRKPPENQLNVYVFNTVSLRWITLPPVTTTRGERPPEVPCSRYAHTAVLIEDIVYIWGGENMDGRLCNNMLYALDVDTHRWLNSDVSGTVPGARRYHTACVLGKVMYVYGGNASFRTGPTNDLYKLDTTTMVWSLINTRGTLPPASLSHSATIIGTKMFVFGGGWKGVLYNNISVFDTETNSWLSTPSAQRLPNERWGHSAFAYNGELYIIFGGVNWLGDTCDDVWRFSPETFSWKAVKPKVVNDPFWMKSDCCCMVGNRVIIFGECSDYDTPEHLYILDLNPSLKTLCKLSVIQYNLEQSELTHDIRWELAALTDGELEDSA